MAHNRDIPIAFTFRSERRVWKVCAYSKPEPPRKKTSLSTELPSIPLPLPAPMPPATSSAPLSVLKGFGPGVDVRVFTGSGILASLFSSSTYTVFATDLSSCLQATFELRENNKLVPESARELLVTFPGEGMDVRERDPWKMRDEFMQLEESNSALLEFLNRWGRWDRAGGALSPVLKLSEIGLDRISREHQPDAALPFLVWKLRSELRTGMVGSADAWLAENMAFGSTERRARYPYIGVTDSTCLDAMKTTITLDHLRRAKWRICARPDCNNIFEVESQHGKTYCKQYCAHLVSVRRTRAAAKKTTKATKRKGA